MATIAVNMRHANADGAIYCGRGPGKCHMNNTETNLKGWLGNPFVGPNAIERFRKAFLDRVAADSEFREEVLGLADHKLACWCKPAPCHVDVIVEWIEANRPRPTTP